MIGDGAPTTADPNTHFLVEQLYYREAELLDDNRFADWLELFGDDLRYWAPTRSNRVRRQQALSVAARDEAAFYDETKQSLAWRIRRLDSRMAWAEDPPSRTRHLVTNVAVDEVGDDLVARSAFLVYRNRLDREVDLYAGRRTDVLRGVGQYGPLIVDRVILLDQNVLLSKNISTFF